MKYNESKSIKELESIMGRVIEMDKKIPMDSFMAEKVMFRIQGQQVIIVPFYKMGLEIASFAACMLLAVSFGIFLGSKFTNDTFYSHQYEITADDSQIERLDVLSAQ